ncbi:hypothetical protein BJV82DRAFT_603555 [Fennellomyces sp. T-0311]|nr:hypothetical protein BJV82DRAFT_603555 [Fennellomyces sp. T-0311]
MSFLHVRSLKRNRIVRRLAVFSVLTALTIFFVTWLTDRPLIDEPRPPSKTRYGHVKEHHHSNTGEVDVTVPRDFVLDSIRRIRKKVPSSQRVLEHTNSNDTSAPDTTYAEDKVYKMPSDDEFLPPGDGTDESERYISFYPHSGFHNQRISLVNALMLAERLNRTLLMPPVVLGEPIHWRKYDSLESFHRRMTKAHLDSCREYINESDNAPEKCQSSFRYTSLRWDRLFDLSAIKQRIRIRYRDDYDRSYLQRKYNITPDDTYHIKDTLLYDYRIADQRDQPMVKYQREVFLWDLKDRPERHISFGSLFGTGRVMYSTPESQELRDFLSKQFVFSRKALPGLFHEADAIIRRIGGPGSYISIHARVGDSIFERFSGDVMGKLWNDLQKYVPLVQQPRTEGCLAPPPSPDAVHWDSMTTSRPLVVFMATDSRDPRNDPLFEKIFQTFPCIVTLNDMFQYEKSNLYDMVNPEDGIQYGKFLVPFLDGLIASHAQEFTGSMWSTFSSYIKFLHQQYTSS